MPNPAASLIASAVMGLVGGAAVAGQPADSLLSESYGIGEDAEPDLQLLQDRLGALLKLIRGEQGIPDDAPYEQIEANGWLTLGQIMTQSSRIIRAYARSGDEAQHMAWRYPCVALDPEISGRGCAAELPLLASRYAFFLASGQLELGLSILNDRVYVPDAEAMLTELDQPPDFQALFRVSQGLLVDRAVLMAMGEREAAAKNLAAIVHMNDLARWQGGLGEQAELSEPSRLGLDVLRYELLLGHLDAPARAAHLRALASLPGPPADRFWRESAVHELGIMFDWSLVLIQQHKADTSRFMRVLADLSVPETPSLTRSQLAESLAAVAAIPRDRLLEVEALRTAYYERFLRASHAERRVVERLAPLDDFLYALDDRYAAISIPSPSLRTVFAIDANKVQRDLTLLMLAIEVHRDAQRALPTSLDELAPAYLPSLPSDPFAADGRYRYVRAADAPGGRGYLLYSVGFDGSDDGGTPDAADLSTLFWRAPLSLSSAGEAGHDWVVSIPPSSLSADLWLSFDRMPTRTLAGQRAGYDSRSPSGE